MYRVLTAAEARAVEELAVAEQGVSLATLMHAAGAAVADEIAERVPEGDLVVLAGPGNNGGDGWVAARELHTGGRSVSVLSQRASRASSPASPQTPRATRSPRASTWSAPAEPPTAGDAGRAPRASSTRCSASVPPARCASRSRRGSRRRTRAARTCSRSTRPPASTPTPGPLSAPSIDADCTVTFTAPKRGLLVYPGAAFAGEIVVADIGIEPSLANVAAAPEIWTAEEYAALAAAARRRRAQGLARPRARDRGLGHVPGRGGARGARRDARGRGLRHARGPAGASSPTAHAHLLAVPVVGLPQGKTHAFASAAASKLVQMAREYDAVVLGPGPHARRRRRRDRALHRRRDERAARHRRRRAQRARRCAGAHRRAQGADGAHAAPGRARPAARHERDRGARQDRIAASAKLATRSVAVVLKGAGTVISVAGRQVINVSGTPALATAGTGDVLAGITGAFLAQGLAPLEAGALAAYVHGRAGEAAASALTPICVTAEDVPEYLPVAVGELLGGW